MIKISQFDTPKNALHTFDTFLFETAFFDVAPRNVKSRNIVLDNGYMLDKTPTNLSKRYISAFLPNFLHTKNQDV